MFGAGILLASSVLDSAGATPLIGNATTVVREVSGLLDTAQRTIYVDSEVFQNEEIVTGPNSATRLLFKDGTNLEMGENSRLKLTKVVFDPDPAKSKLAVKTVVGVFRWTSGSLPSSNYGIGTPVATIGIRGTTLEWIVADDGMSTIALTHGKVVVTNTHGESVTLLPGQATTVMPPDPDGSQLAPSEPGDLPASLRDQIMKMTRTVRVNEVQDVNPTAGGNSGTFGVGMPQIGGPGGFLRPVSFPGDGGPGGPFVFPSPPTFGPPTLRSGNPPSGSSTPPPPPPGSTTPPPVIIVTPPGPGAPPPGLPTPPTTTKVAKVDFALVHQGDKKSFGLAMKVGTGTIIMADAEILGDPRHVFVLSGFTKDEVLTGDAALLAFLTFAPGFSDLGTLTAELDFTDSLGNKYEFDLAGTAIAAIGEPGALLLLAGGLGGLAWTRRRRRR